MNTMEVMIDGHPQKRRIDRIDTIQFFGENGPFEMPSLPYPEHGDDEIVCQTLDGQTTIVRAAPATE